MNKSDDIKHRLRTEHGMTIKDFCLRYDLPYRTASNVLRGICLARYGKGRLVADKLYEMTGIRL